MKRVFIVLLALFALLKMPGVAQRPAGFSWIDTASDKATMNIVHRALKTDSHNSIRRVGVEDGFALVLTTVHEDEDSDRWTIYSLSLATGKTQILVSGYKVKLAEWIGKNTPELALTYYDCWGCEAATLFTTLHFTKGTGWSARWQNKTVDPNYPQPGAVVSYGDAGEPYDDDVVDQIFAVVSLPDGSFAAGSWYHSRDTKTGKIQNDVERYSIDQATGKDLIEKLTGAQSLEWRRKICTQSNALTKASIGQDSKSCRNILRMQSPTGAHTK
jgi:hypothetical protein